MPTLAILGSAPASAADPVTVNLLNINDFHGRIDANTTKFATTVEQLRAGAGEDNTLFLSAGDNIGASLFASSYQQDQPTIDVLNALDLAGSAVGNHEFDKGIDDLTGRVSDAADWGYLGANVYEEGTQTPVLDEYATYEVAGLTVGVIGTVTQETPTLVSPAGVADLDFGNAVEATNRVAAQLSDGDEANGEADVIVAEFHAGAGAGTPDGSTLEDEVDAGGEFADIVENTSPEVDAIFTGHTHKQYAWDAPVPGTDGTRPILQTGSYGENIGQIELSVDPDTGEVVDYTGQNVARVATADTTTYPRVAEVDQIVTQALADAAVVGNQKIADITGDITTAFSGGDYVNGVYTGAGPNPTTGRDDRSRESTIGGLVANALRDGVSDVADVDLGLTNPGGLRAELLYAGDTSTNPQNTDGVVTFAEANSVLPFSNTIAVVTLSGADLKAVLEQQWQPAAADRPYLQLGLSDNVHVVADPTRSEGSRIVSVTIDGELLDPAAEYAVSTFSFLAAGGDNFTAFTEGDYVDTGFLDAEMWRSYLADSSPISPEFARQQVFTSGFPTATTPGATVSAELGVGATTAPVFPVNAKSLDLTSLGSRRTPRCRSR
ncbi:bifunctional metallophosphatase/5'-nucleotidase [Nocardioides sambongensis]|uniref:bifunctional metallophosphatase/5'-nucleotidase n=1 Tax=Nocardioides sambongensis TaxID=2589074 RepID=UPI0018C8ADAA|nr:bifunctional UDP-sugar hydrolase/5'-nucleotidase [Nocardioides sambongensis]